jgi:RimJ/RimL family protein N-acetyltransferase
MPSQVELAPCTVGQLAKLELFSENDPAIAFVPPDEREELTSKDPEVLMGAYSGEHLLAWSVQHEGRVIGMTALASQVNGVGTELFLAPEYRRRGFGELATAGLLRAIFTPRLVRSQNNLLTPDDRIWRAVAEITPGNIPSKRLTRRFGFTYKTHRLAAPGFRYGIYDLYGGTFPGHAETGKRHQGTLRAHALLSQYRVTSEGDVPIADAPDDLLKPFVMPWATSDTQE